VASIGIPGLIAPIGEHQDVTEGIQIRIQPSDWRNAMQHPSVVEEDRVERLGECERSAHGSSNYI